MFSMTKNSKSKIPNSRPQLLMGFTIVEILVVLGIMAFLAAMVGLTVYGSRRNDLMLEQAAQNLVSEIRLSQSKTTAIQEVTAGGSTFFPKATMIRVATNSNPEIYYLESNRSIQFGIGANPSPCEVGASGAWRRLYKTIPLEAGTFVSRIVSVTQGGSQNAVSPVYLIYISPIGRFYATRNAPNFIEGSSNTCVPRSADLVNNYEKIVIILNNGGPRSFNIEVAKDSGSATILPQ